MKSIPIMAFLLLAALLLATPFAVPAARADAGSDCISACSDAMGSAIPGCWNDGLWNGGCLNAMESAAKGCIDECTTKPVPCASACATIYQPNVWKCVDSAQSAGDCGDVVRSAWTYCVNTYCQ